MEFLESIFLVEDPVAVSLSIFASFLVESLKGVLGFIGKLRKNLGKKGKIQQVQAARKELSQFY